MEGLKNIGPRPTSLGLEKLKILKKYLWLFNLVPYSRRFFLVGSLARNEAKPESDIDLVISAKHNRVWFNRLLLNIAAQVIGKRRGKRARADRFCFNASFSNHYDLPPKTLYPYQILLRQNTNSIFITRVRTILEYLLEVTLLGVIFEYISRRLLTNYIYKRFRHFKLQKGEVLILKDNYIIYHPPSPKLRRISPLYLNSSLVEKM